LREAREILAHSDRAIQLVTRASQGQLGRLAVGLCGPATAPFLPRLIQEFRRREAGVTLSLKDIDPAHQPEALANGKIDIGFTRSVGPKFRKVLVSQVLFTESLVVALPKGHTLAGEQKLRVLQLAQEPFVLYSREAAPELFDAIVTVCRRAKFSPRIVDSPALWQSVLTMIEAGEGVSIVPACVQQLRSDGVLFRPLRDRGCYIEVVMAWRREDANAIRDSFLDLLRKNASEIERIMKST
jgi:DNA-binding transcriptional LysR family regulator